MSLTYGFCLDDLSSMYDSAQFSDAMNAVTGDGVTDYGSRLSLTVNGFTVTLGSGYALTAGRWVENDEPLAFPLKGSGNTEDRYDALGARVDYSNRKAALEVIQNVDPDKLPGDLRNGGEYSVILYLIRIRRGASSLTPDDVTDFREAPDMCGTIVPLSSIAEDVLYVYQYLQTGIDENVERIIALIQAVIDSATSQIQAVVDKANTAIDALNKQIQNTGSGPQIGDLRTARLPPEPKTDWLLCDGSPVPENYYILSELLSGNLPNISGAEERYRTYIYAGSEI